MTQTTKLHAENDNRQITTLSIQPPRTRQRRIKPAYPTLAGFIALSVAACTNTGSPRDNQPKDPTTVVVPPTTAATGKSETPTTPEGSDGWLKKLSFPEDKAPLQNVACAGDCPPPHQMATTAKDRSQIEARIRRCQRLAERKHADIKGRVMVTGEIGKNGSAKQVEIKTEGAIPKQVDRCVKILVQHARFSTEHGLNRRIYVNKALDQ